MKAPRTAVTVLLIGLLLIAASLPAATAREHKEKDNDRAHEKQSGRGKGPPQNESSQPREAGRFVQANLSDYQGRYVSFSFDAQSCRIGALSVYNVSVFSGIQLPSPCESRDKGQGRDEHGSLFEIRGGDASVKIHDAPNGLLHLDAHEDDTLELTPAEGASFNDTRSFSVGNLTGLLRVEDEDLEGNSSWTLTGKARFWVHPMTGGSAERVEIRQAIKERRVAGEIDVLVDNGTVSSEVLTYEDVVIKSQRTSNGSFRFLVDGNLTSGRTFVVNLGPGVFEQEKVGLRYWDLDETSLATEVAITEADSLEDVLEVQPGEGPEYWITEDKAGKHVLVAVPHFSVHVFEVMSLPTEVVPVVIYGALAGLLFVGVGGVGLFRRRGL